MRVARHGMAWRGGQGRAGLGVAWLSKAGHGSLSRARAGQGRVGWTERAGMKRRRLVLSARIRVPEPTNRLGPPAGCVSRIRADAAPPGPLPFRSLPLLPTRPPPPRPQ